MTEESTQPKWADLPSADLMGRLHTTPEGLSAAEASQRIGKCGWNELPETRVSPALKFLSYFWGPIAWMIEVAAVLSALVHHWA